MFLFHCPFGNELGKIKSNVTFTIKQSEYINNIFESNIIFGGR